MAVDGGPPPVRSTAAGAGRPIPHPTSVLRRLWRGEIRPARPPPSPIPQVPTRYLWLGLLIVAGTLILVELVYTLYPLPPGIDSGDWIQRSYAWVGLAHPPMDAVGSPYLYSPMIFPLLGITVLAAGSPSNAGFVFGGFLLVVFGLSVVHLSRRYFLSGPFQVLFVGLAVLNGTTLQMLFWGGYPNFLALAFFNEALIFLLAFLRSRATVDGLLFYGMVALIFLTHALTFAIFAATLGTLAVLLLIADRRWIGLILSPGNLAGLALVGVTVGGYEAIIKLLHIQVPGYIGSNPAAFQIDNVGEVFRPLGSAPMFLPMGTGVNLTPDFTLALLIGSCLLLILLLLGVSWSRPDWADHRHFVAVAALIAALAVPAVGYLAHVDTDYTRFVYFLPLPVSLVLALAFETMLAHRLAAPAPSVPPDAVGPGTPSLAVRPSGTREALATAGVLLLLLLVAANVTAPMALANEQSNGGNDHSPGFVDAAQALDSNPQAGSVLTTQGAVRWVEALTDRGAFDIGPTWLLFEPWQVTNAEETFWTFNSAYAITNNLQVVSFTGSQTKNIMQAPMYSAIVQGVTFPIFRILPSQVMAEVTTGSSSAWLQAVSGEPPIWNPPTGTAPASSILFTGTAFTILENDTTAPGGSTWLNFTIRPDPGQTVGAVSIPLTAPPNGITLLKPATPVGLNSTEPSPSMGILYWNVSGTLGQYPGSYGVSTVVTSVPAPSSENLTVPSPTCSATLNFTNPSPGLPFQVDLQVSTPGASNPAIVLPPVLNGSAFLQAHDIHFLFLPVQNGFYPTGSFYQDVYRFNKSYNNSEWVIYQG